MISFARGAPSLDIVDVEGLKAAAERAFERDPAGTTAYGTAVGYVPLREWIADKHGVDDVAGDRHQRLDAGRRVPVRDAGPARRRGRRREADLRPHAAEPARPRRRHPRGRAARPTASTSTRWRAAARRGRRARSSRTSSPTSRTRPATRSRSTKRGRAAALAARVRLRDLRGRPLRRHPLQRRGAADDALAGRRPGRVVYASSFSKTVCPGIRVGYLVGPAELIAEIQSWRPTPTSRRTWWPSRSSTSSAPAATSTARSRRSRPRWPSASRALTEALAARAARGAVPGARGRLLHVGRAARGHRRRPRSSTRPTRAACVRQGHRLPARGRREHAAPRLLGRHRGPDRRGRRAAGRGREGRRGRRRRCEPRHSRRAAPRRRARSVATIGWGALCGARLLGCRSRTCGRRRVVRPSLAFGARADVDGGPDRPFVAEARVQGIPAVKRASKRQDPPRARRTAHTSRRPHEDAGRAHGPRQLPPLGAIDTTPRALTAVAARAAASRSRPRQVAEPATAAHALATSRRARPRAPTAPAAARASSCRPPPAGRPTRGPGRRCETSPPAPPRRPRPPRAGVHIR